MGSVNDMKDLPDSRSFRAWTTGSEGCGKGIRSMRTSRQVDPGTSTPCQSESVPNRQVEGSAVNCRTSAPVRSSPWHRKLGSPSPENRRRISSVAAWAARLLDHWVEQRTTLGIPGSMLFPSTRSSGKPWGKVSQYESVRKVLAAAGVDEGEGGSYRLRDTFALRQLRRGTPAEEVARWLGVTDPGVMARYARALRDRADVV